MNGLEMIALGLLGQLVPIAYSSFVDLYKREADPAFFQTYSVGSTSNNLDCKYGGCGGGSFRFSDSKASPQSLGYTNGNREASPSYGYGKREASSGYEGLNWGKREASSGYEGLNWGKREASSGYEGLNWGKREVLTGGLGYDLNGNRVWPSLDDVYRKREASPQFTQFNDAATYQNFDCRPSTGCQVVGSNIPSPVGSRPLRVASPPRKVVQSPSTRVTSPSRKEESNQPPRITSRPTVNNSPSRVVVDYQPASDECKCDFNQMLVFIGYDNFECSSISTSEGDGSVCFYKNNSDEDTSCKCG